MFGFGPAYAQIIRPKSGYKLSRTESAKKEVIETECPDVGMMDEVEKEWTRVFQRLDKVRAREVKIFSFSCVYWIFSSEVDGNSDGRIDRKAFVKWVSALDLQKTIEFEANLNITPRELERLVSRADKNKDGFVDKAKNA